MMNYSIKDLPQEERPRERLIRHGTDVLSAVELLAIVLGNGTKGKSVLQLAQELLSLFGSLAALSEATIQEICQVHGVGQAKAIQLKAALSLATRISKAEGNKSSITSPASAYVLVKSLFEKEKRELFATILQDARGKMIRCEIVSIGTLTQTLVHPREVFYPAIRHGAASLILLHNHPSGDLNPSAEDIRVTHALISAGQMMNIPIQDHLIISSQGYLSFREKNLCYF